MNRTLFCVVLSALTAALPLQGRAQEAPAAYKSSPRALALSLLVPGLGHQYVHDGSWDGAASAFALADAGLWLSLIGTEWRRAQLTRSYQVLATSRAGAYVDGKDWAFFLNLATYRSSDAYLEAQLRNRVWHRLDYVADRAFQWAWASEEDFRRFAELREDAASLRRRQPFLVALLVGNRLLAGLTALRATARANHARPDLSLSLSAPPFDSEAPLLNLHLQW